jgi:hypothetical protein
MEIMEILAVSGAIFGGVKGTPGAVLGIFDVLDAFPWGAVEFLANS